MIQNSFSVNRSLLFAKIFIAISLVGSSCKPKDDVEFRQVRDIVLDANTDPIMRANAVLFNPNDVRMKLRKINVHISVNGKNAAHIDQEMKLEIPANKEFIVPLEAKLNLKELGLLDTIFGIIGGKKMKLDFKGSISITYKGVPLKVPVKYQSEIRVKM